MRSRDATAPLDHLFHALSDPTRRRMLATLARGEQNFTQLAGGTRLSPTAVAKHLKALERGKLVRRRPDRSDRRAVVFELRPRPLQAGIDWMEKHRRYWQERFDGLEAFVAANYRPAKRGPAQEPPRVRPRR